MHPDVKTMVLSGGHATIVDWEDYLWLGQWKWSYSHGYAMRKEKGKTIYMHNVILGKYVDHVDGDTLNNTRDNIRLCSVAQNGRNRGRNKNNTSGYKGVFKQTKSNTWIARIVVDKQPIYLGSFKTPEKASEVYQKAAKKYFGDFAYA